MKNDEVLAEVQRLEGVRLKIREFNDSGDSIWDAIDAQIDVLVGNIEEEDMGEISNQYILLAVRDAIDWMHGDRDDSPSSDWIAIV